MAARKPKTRLTRLLGRVNIPWEKIEPDLEVVVSAVLDGARRPSGSELAQYVREEYGVSLHRSTLVAKLTRMLNDRQA